MYERTPKIDGRLRYNLARLRLRPTRRVDIAAPVAGSWTSSGKNQAQLGPMNGLDAYERQNLHDRSRGDDSTERGGDCQPSCAADGRGDRPDVSQRVCAGPSVRTRDCRVFS